MRCKPCVQVIFLTPKASSLNHRVSKCLPLSRVLVKHRDFYAAHSETLNKCGVEPSNLFLRDVSDEGKL